MNANWTTKSGKNVKVSFVTFDRSSIVGCENLVIDGKGYTNPHLTNNNAGIEFTDGLKGQKLAISVPADVTEKINALARESGKITEAQRAASKAEDEYQSNVRLIKNAMSK